MKHRSFARVAEDRQAIVDEGPNLVLLQPDSCTLVVVSRVLIAQNTLLNFPPLLPKGGTLSGKPAKRRANQGSEERFVTR